MNNKKGMGLKELSRALVERKISFPRTRPTLTTFTAEDLSESEVVANEILERLPDEMRWVAEELWGILSLDPVQQDIQAQNLVKIEQYRDDFINTKDSPTIAEAARDLYALALVETCPALEGKDGAKPWLVRRSSDRKPEGQKQSLIDQLVRLAVAEVTNNPTAVPTVRAWQDTLLLKGRMARKIAAALETLVAEVRKRSARHTAAQSDSALNQNPDDYTVRNHLYKGVDVQEFAMEVPRGPIQKRDGTTRFCGGGTLVVHSRGGIVVPVRGIGGIAHEVKQMIDSEVELKVTDLAGDGRIDVSRQYLAQFPTEKNKSSAVGQHYGFRTLIQRAAGREERADAFDLEREAESRFFEEQLIALTKAGDITDLEFIEGKVGRAVLDFGSGKFTVEKDGDKTDVYHSILVMERTEPGKVRLVGFRRKFDGKLIRDPGPEAIVGQYLGQTLDEGEKEFSAIREAAPTLGKLLKATCTRTLQRAKQEVEATGERARIASVAEAAEAARDTKWAAEAATASDLIANDTPVADEDAEPAPTDE